MSSSHYDREEAALVAYFSQMLSLDDSQTKKELESFKTPDEGSQLNANSVSKSESDLTLQPQLQVAPIAAKAQALPYAQGKSLEILLQEIETSEVKEQEKEQAQEQVKEQVQEDIKEQVQEPKIEVASAPAIVTATNLETTKVQEQEQEVASKLDNSTADAWENIDLGNTFQTLFFVVQGVRFAVPLICLGGIFQYDKCTKLFGKPDWYMGITDIRGQKLNIVDTFRFVKPEIGESPEKYDYIIKLGESNWSLGCNQLEGNRTISKDQVKWRVTAGNRPYLAGIVKEEMCALLHVDAMIKMFETKSPSNQNEA